MSRWAWCLVQDDDTLATGWQLIDNKWYYFYSNGEMACSTWVNNGDNITPKWYYFDDNGVMVTGTKTIENIEYNFSTDSNSLGLMIEDKNKSLVSDKLVEFVKGWEQFYSYKYDDGTGVITQGYGATGSEIENWSNNITESEASAELVKTINSNYAEKIQNDLIDRNITIKQNEFDALVSLAYNIGINGLLNSTLYKYIIEGSRDVDTIRDYFCMWDKANGKVMQGLYKRRVAEANMFNYAVYDSTH